MAFVLQYGEVGGAVRRRPPYFRTKKLGLLGATENIAHAPWTDPSWTLAAHPCCRNKCKREPDWYFDLHRKECFENEHKAWNPKYFSWLKALATPIFMQENWKEIPLAVRYPFEVVDQEYAGPTGTLFATNHCAYMIALAMMEGVETLGLFGCQYGGDERTVQRESLYYWVGRYEQWGGKVIIPRKHNSLFTVPLYGYASHDDKGKLIGEYKVTPTVKVVAKDGTVGKSDITVIGRADIGRLQLATPPPGVVPAIDRLLEYFPKQETQETPHAVPEGPQALSEKEAHSDGIAVEPEGSHPGGDRLEPDRGDRTTPYEGGRWYPDTAWFPGLSNNTVPATRKEYMEPTQLTLPLGQSPPNGDGGGDVNPDRSGLGHGPAGQGPGEDRLRSGG